MLPLWPAPHYSLIIIIIIIRSNISIIVRSIVSIVIMIVIAIFKVFTPTTGLGRATSERTQGERARARARELES